MGLQDYKSALWRFTWKGRFTDDGHGKAVPILGPCKDQRGMGGICVFMGCATAMEGHLRMNSIFDEISYEDLASKVDTLKSDPVWSKKTKVQRCLEMIKERGALTQATKDNPVDSQVSYKFRSYEAFPMNHEGAMIRALRVYMKVGPMVGVFPVELRIWAAYSDTEVDAIHFVKPDRSPLGPQSITHCITLVGFGSHAKVPFFPFQNTYGRNWRRNARGFGQLFAPSLIEMYGFVLELGQPQST